MTVYSIDRLTETARLNLMAGVIEVYDITYKHCNKKSRFMISDYKWKGISIVFSYNGRNKILLYNN